MQNRNKEKKERKKIGNFIKENGAVKKIRGFIKENGTIKKIRGLIKVNKPVSIAVTVLACLVLVGVSFTVYSKYYKTGYNKGVATASGFYFNSNYMAAVDELRGKTGDNIDDIFNLEGDVLETIIRSANDTSWSNYDDPYAFYVEVRNYDNQLLYNDKDLDVEYAVHFMLLEDPVGSKFTVSFDDKTEGLTKKGDIVSFTGSLAGGKANYDRYTVSVALTGSSEDPDYEPTDILMVAYPTEPVYLHDTKVIAGFLRANFEEKEFQIDEAKSGFVIRNAEDYNPDSTEEDNIYWKDMVWEESGYEYRLYTSGNYTGNGSATRKTILVMWRSDMYKINEFDEYYQDVKGTDKYKDCTLIVNDGHEWMGMEIDILPFASIKFLFFRNPDKDNGFEKVFDNITKEEDFRYSVKVVEVED